MEAAVRERPVGSTGKRDKLLPVRVVRSMRLRRNQPAEVAPTPSGTIHIELPGRALISLEGSVDPAMIRAVLRSLGA